MGSHGSSCFKNQYLIQLTISRPFFKPFFGGIAGVSFFAFDEKNDIRALGLFRLFEDKKIDSFVIYIMYYVLK
jgi:hypothetical protein